MKWTSIEDLLAEDSTHIDDLAIRWVGPEDEATPDDPTPEDAAPEDLEATPNHTINFSDLDALAGMMCDRISLLLEIEQERSGFPKHASFPSRTAHPAFDRSELLRFDTLARLTQEMSYRLYRRLELEQERQGYARGRLSW